MICIIGWRAYSMSMRGFLERKGFIGFKCVIHSFYSPFYVLAYANLITPPQNPRDCNRRDSHARFGDMYIPTSAGELTPLTDTHCNLS